jgi:hypothetical protein
MQDKQDNYKSVWDSGQNDIIFKPRRNLKYFSGNRLGQINHIIRRKKKILNWLDYEEFLNY